MSAFDMPGDLNLGAEYRVLAGLGDEGIESGWLFELQYAPITYFTLGLGYNFTSFSDDELDPGLNDRSGVYFERWATKKTWTTKMIGLLRGHVLQTDFKRVLLDVNGVGYQVQLPLVDLDKWSLVRRYPLFTRMFEKTR